MKPLLAYWDIRGLAEPIRLMLEYLDVEYEEKRYVVGEAPEFSRKSWDNVKDSLDLVFPNLPYYIDDEVKITESWAIMRHISRRYNLMLVDSKEAALTDQLEGLVQDFRFSFVMMCYLPDFENNKKEFFQNLPNFMKRFEQHLTSHKWLVGDKLTHVDFAFAEILDQMQLMNKEVFSDYPHIGEYLKAFMSQKQIDAYRKSDRFPRNRCNNKYASWSGPN